VDTLFVFFNGRSPLPSLPLHLQSMVGRNGLCSGYKSQRTKGHRGGKKTELGGKKKREPGQEPEKKKTTGEGTQRDRTRALANTTSNPSCLYCHLFRPEQGKTERHQGSRPSFPCFFPNTSFQNQRKRGKKREKQGRANREKRPGTKKMKKTEEE